MRAEKTLNSQSRANLVRERRNQQSQQRVNAIRKNPAQANRTYKSTVRGSTAPLRQVAAPKVRRQVYYALGTSGAELRLPAVPFIHFGWRLISGMLVILLGLALYAIIYSPRFQVSGIQIEGIQRLTSGDISAVVDISGKSIVNFNPKQAADALASAFPELAETLHDFVSFADALSVNGDDFVARLDEVADGGLHAGASGPRHGDGEGVGLAAPVVPGAVEAAFREAGFEVRRGG